MIRFPFSVFRGEMSLIKHSRVALFIDGGYIDEILKRFNMARIDYNQLVVELSKNYDLLRTYYYHCLPHQSQNPSPEDKNKFSRAQRFFRRLDRLDSFTVRMGKWGMMMKVDKYMNKKELMLCLPRISLCTVLKD